MADTGQLLGGASGALTGAKIGTAIAPGIGTVAGGLIGGVAGLFSSKSSKAPAYQPLDISKVISDAREAAKTNYASSIALEQQYRPGTAALRSTLDTQLGQLTQPEQGSQAVRDSLLSQLGGSAVDNPLLAESANRILGNLRLGGALGADVQAQAMQAALQKGGAAGISGSGAARGLVARDLGLTSLGVEQQRIAQAQQAGQTMATLNLQDILGRYNAAQGAVGQDLQSQIGRTGLLASVIDARALPESGLNPGSIAGLYVADKNAAQQSSTNAAQISQAQRNANLSMLLGLGSQVASGGYNQALSGIGSLFGGAKASGIGSEEDELVSLMKYS